MVKKLFACALITVTFLQSYPMEEDNITMGETVEDDIVMRETVSNKRNSALLTTRTDDLATQHKRKKKKLKIEPRCHQREDQRDNYDQADWSVLAPELRESIATEVIKNQDPLKSCQSINNLRLTCTSFSATAKSKPINMPVAQGFVRKYPHKANKGFEQACATGNYTMVKALLKAGINIRSKELAAKKPLILAAKNGHCLIVQFLINKQVSVTDRGQGGLTALEHALALGHQEIVQLLIDSKALADENHEISKLLSAIALHDTNKAVALIQTTDVNTRNQVGKTALMYACIANSCELVQLLLTHNADVNAQDEIGLSTLFLAAYLGHEEIFDLLVTAGADINSRGKRG